MSDTKKPDPIDIAVGQHIKDLRTSAGMSQERMAGHLGITFQQVQKYEKGTNRISASRLVHIAEALGVSPGDLLPSGSNVKSLQPTPLQAIIRENDELRAELARIGREAGALSRGLRRQEFASA